MGFRYTAHGAFDSAVSFVIADRTCFRSGFPLFSQNENDKTIVARCAAASPSEAQAAGRISIGDLSVDITLYHRPVEKRNFSDRGAQKWACVTSVYTSSADFSS